MGESKSSLILHLILLTALCGILFFLYLGSWPFFDKGEPREALAVQNIFLHGDWLFPLKRGTDIPSKPPLFHWFAALASHAWGEVNEVTVRFPSALFATLGVLILYPLGRRLFDPQVALLGCIILASTFVYQSQAITARVDMTLTFFVTLTLVTFYSIYRRFLTGCLWQYAFYFVLGISVLAKGPVGIILPVLIIGSFLGLRKKWDVLFRLCFHKGVILTLAIVIAWYGMALVTGGENFFDRQIMHENLGRYFGQGGHQHPVYYYLPYFFLKGLPWSIFLPFMVSGWFRDASFDREESLFLKLWVLVVFVFFSLSVGKRPVYLLPLYPPLSLLIAEWFSGPPVAGKGKRVLFQWMGVGSLLTGLILLVFLLGKLWEMDATWFLSALEPVLKPKDYAKLLDGLNQLGWPFIFTGFLSSLLWILLARDLWSFRIHSLPSKLALISILSGLSAQGFAISSIAEVRSYRSFMTEVNQRIDPDADLYLYGRSFNSDSLVIYRGGPIPVLEELPEALVKRLRSGNDFVILRQKEWRRIRELNRDLPPAMLKSAGTGPEGNAHLVLVQGRKFSASNPGSQSAYALPFQPHERKWGDPSVINLLSIQ